ncbi:MAG: hypothetical protein ABI556_00665 [Gemmatimonadales bacterium]
MSERRFSEEEVSEILKYAAESQQSSGSPLPSAKGLTLAELTDIGREVGIAPEAMQLAAQRIGKTDQTTRTILGLPLGVGRTVELNRKLTDDEWDRLVADLRATFDARGVVKQEGSLRTWTNGNLQVHLEPTATGQRLRLRTVKGSAPGLIMGGIGLSALGSVLFVIAGVAGALADRGFLAAVSTLAVGGVTMFASGAVGLPSWARLRQKQMDSIADHVLTTAQADQQLLR